MFCSTDKLVFLHQAEFSLKDEFSGELYGAAVSDCVDQDIATICIAAGDSVIYWEVSKNGTETVKELIGKPPKYGSFHEKWVFIQPCFNPHVFIVGSFHHLRCIDITVCFLLNITIFIHSVIFF